MRRKVFFVSIAILVVLLAVASVFYFFFPEEILKLYVKRGMKQAGLRQYSVEIGGRPIEYLAGGKGEPLLLLHGFGADKYNWLDVAQYLTPSFHVIAPDLPGHGRSDKSFEESYSYQDYMDFLHAFVDRLNIGRFHLAGNSMGGHIAALYGGRYPDEVETLWLLAPGGVTSARKSEFQKMTERGENPILIENEKDFDRLMDMVFVKKPFLPGPVKQYLAKRAVADKKLQEKIKNDLSANYLSLESEVQGLQVPTLILWGDRDQLLDVSGAEILGSILPNATVVVLENTGHIPMVEKPEESAGVFFAFQEKR